MALLAVNKDGTELISDFDLYRNGTRKKYMNCDPAKCDKCWSSRLRCKKDENGKMYRLEIYSDPPRMDREKAIEALSFWDNFEFDPDCNKLDFTVVLPKGSIKKLTGREMTWADDPVEI